MTFLHRIAQIATQLTEADLPAFRSWFQQYKAFLPVIGTGLYDRLDPDDQERFILWFLKRWAMIDLVNPVEMAGYLATVKRVRDEPRTCESLHGREYFLRSMAPQGHDFDLLGYQWFLGVHDIHYDQYQHKDVTLRPDDVIIDAGAFIGDTAVYFHHSLHGACEVHCFELLDENLGLLVDNLTRNGVREDQVVINKLALSDRTGEEIVVGRAALQGATSMYGTDPDGDRVQTITLDDYVIGTDLRRVDFIKMDIEGAEVAALRGARNTIRHFRPRLAICLYHRWDDVITIPAVLEEIGVAYRYAFKWVQLTDGWEAVLLATPDASPNRHTNVPGASPHTDTDLVFRLLDRMFGDASPYI